MSKHNFRPTKKNKPHERKKKRKDKQKKLKKNVRKKRPIRFARHEYENYLPGYHPSPKKRRPKANPSPSFDFVFQQLILVTKI